MGIACKIVRHSVMNGLHFTAENGWKLSVQMGGGNYCSNRDLSGSWLEAPGEKGLPSCSDAEIAIYGSGGLIEFEDGDTVAGWVAWTEILDRWLPLIRQTAAPLTAKTVAELVAALPAGAVGSHARSEVA